MSEVLEERFYKAGDGVGYVAYRDGEFERAHFVGHRDEVLKMIKRFAMEVA